jgi:putative endonuclease
MRDWWHSVWRILGVRAAADKSGDTSSGAQAEALACAHLAARHVRILARNVRCRGGEVDIVGLQGDALLFVEVRLRSNSRYGGAAASITAAKQRRILLAARYWLHGAGRAYARRPQRFDAVLLASLDPAQIEWLQGAFEPPAA